jgi:hypothetical protein
MPTSQWRAGVLVCRWSATAIVLQASPTLDVQPAVTATVTITPDRPLTVVLGVADREPLVYVDPATAWAALEADEAVWRRWCRATDDELPGRDAVAGASSRFASSRPHHPTVSPASTHSASTTRPKRRSCSTTRPGCLGWPADLSTD